TTAANFKVALQDTITETAVAGSGTDTVQLRLLAGTDYSLMANATTLTLGANLENFDASATGTTKLNLTGNALANTLTGNDADNILDGGAGNDTLIGGLGSDTLRGGAGVDVFQYVNATDSTASSMDTILDFTQGVDKLDFSILNGGGFDLSFSGTTASTNSIWYTHSQDKTFLYADTTGDAIADFQLQLTGNINLDSFDFYLQRATTKFGTNADDAVTMNSEIDTYYGLAGNDFITGNDYASLVDTMFGQEGDDILFGKGGSDVMDGGSGNDTFLYSSDIVYNNSVDKILNFNASEDKFQFNESYPYFKDLKGAVDPDEVRIGAGYISALDDNDYIIYNTSTGDIYYDYDANGPQTAYKFANLINPTGTITYLNFTVLMSGQTLIGTGNADTLTATSTSSDDYIFGGNGDDIINGNGSVYGDNLFGGDGNDTISGSGYTYMAGGKGNDTYYAGPYSTISEHENEGEDTIVFLGYGTAYRLEDTPNVENLVFPNSIGNGLTDSLLVGNALNNKLTGNDYVNTLIGNEGNDRLNAGAGDDILWGGLGNDVLIGGSGADTFKWFSPDAVNPGNVANNTDTVTDFSIADDDSLDLRDLLTGESSNNILQYLDISIQGGSTEIRISSAGNFTGGNYNSAEEDARIVLSNTNLYTATGTNNEAQLIGYLAQHNNLLID
ncbi:MAG TPA: calcium-binding protein, partial [Methylophilus sp.]|uniref:calcium-binding protein n=1 Tax=Methylophilus sp. TaxID=29541 RepID=UPI002BEAD7F8